MHVISMVCAATHWTPAVPHEFLNQGLLCISQATTFRELIFKAKLITFEDEHLVNASLMKCNKALFTWSKFWGCIKSAKSFCCKQLVLHSTKPLRCLRIFNKLQKFLLQIF